MPTDISDFLDGLDQEESDSTAPPSKQGVAEDIAPQPPVSQNISDSPTSDGQREIFENYLDRIVAQAKIPEEPVEIMKRELNQLIEAEDINTALKNLRVNNANLMKKAFWDIYLHTFFKHREDPQDKLLLYMLRYGLIDERLVSDSNLEFLAQHMNPTDPPEGNIMPLSTWLKILYDAKETPSITELGVDYNKHLREELKHMSVREKKENESKSQIEKKRDFIRYEIENMIKSVSNMMIMHPLFSIFPLIDAQMGMLKMSYVTPKKIRETVNEIKEYDFSIFYRESVYHPNLNTSEIIQFEIEPYFVIFPICGDKIIFWQDISNGKKSTRGRIFLPAIFIGDFKKAMIQALANFRWELCRSSKGALWTDPVEGGITGAFYDYVTFYKRNNKLSFEAKTKLEEAIRRNRKNQKKIFLDYYFIWVEYERKGILKLDRVARDIFFRHIPFIKSTRDKLKKIPIYADLINRHDNLSKRNIDRLELKYKKRRDFQGNLPKQLQDNLDFYLK